MSNISPEQFASIAKKTRPKRRKKSWVPHVLISVSTVIIGAYIVNYRSSHARQVVQQNIAAPWQARQKKQTSPEPQIRIETQPQQDNAGRDVVRMSQFPRLLECKYYGTLANDYRGTTMFVFVAVVENPSREAIDEANFYIRSRAPSRTVPSAETVENVSIPGGVEPGERKAVVISIPTSRVGVYGTVFPPSDPVELAIVKGIPTSKPYIEFKHCDFVLAEFRKVEDPNLNLIFGE